ncbi:MAG: efflux RND transporter periplasmic adaptor subunit [Rhodospirillales bacterium]|nr:efflux RND transporter periplasmic adaptor subunit [Rhodospirillales bacterium]
MTELSRPAPAGNIDDILGNRPSGGARLFARWKGVLLLAVLAGVAAGAVFLLNARSAGNGIRYVTAPVTKGDLHVIVTATGSIQPTTKVDISSELSGIVRRVFVDHNSKVARGQVLAQLDTDKLLATVESSRAKLAATRAKVAEIEATIEETTREFERKKALSAGSIISVREFELARAAHNRAVAQLASSKADVAAAEAEMKINETNLAKASIYSPIDGVVLKRSVDPGQTVASSLQAPVLFTIAEDLTKMEAQVDIDEADVGKVREGQSASFAVDAYPDRKFPAQLRELRFASETVQGVVTYKGILTVDNAEMLLRPGMTATAEISVQDVRDAVLVPNAALRFAPPAETARSRTLVQQFTSFMPRLRPPSPREASGPGRKVWVEDNATPRAIPVSIGATDGKLTQILAGEIGPGQAVIVDSVAAKK